MGGVGIIQVGEFQGQGILAGAQHQGRLHGTKLTIHAESRDARCKGGIGQIGDGRIDDAEAGRPAEIEMAVGVTQDRLLEERATVDAILCAESDPAQDETGFAHGNRIDPGDIARRRRPVTAGRVPGQGHRHAFAGRCQARSVLGEEDQPVHFGEPVPSVRIPFQLVRLGESLLGSILPDHIRSRVVTEPAIVPHADQVSVLHLQDVPHQFEGIQFGMPVPEHVDPTGLRIELSHAAIDGNPETPLAVLIEAADAIPVGRSFQVGDIHAHRFVPTVMAQSAGLHTVQAVIKRSHPDAVPAVHEQADDQFIPEFLPILANRVGGRVILLQAMDGSHQDTPVRSLCQAFHAFVRHPAGGEGGIVHRPELVDARIPVQEALRLRGDPDAAPRIGVDVCDVRMGIYPFPIHRFQIREFLPASVRIQDADT